jgi:hypothetical protein
MALSSASGPSSRPPVIWPRSAILHSAAASMVDGTFGLTVSIADRIATGLARSPAHGARSMAFWTMWTLSSSVGKMLTAASVMISARSIGRHVHHEAVADAPLGAQAGVALGTTAAISSSVCRLPFISASPCPRAPGAPPSRRGLAVRGVDKLAARDVDASELSSQGYATAQGVGGTALQRSISRSYFSCWRSVISSPLFGSIVSQSCVRPCVSPAARAPAQAMMLTPPST